MSKVRLLDTESIHALTLLPCAGSNVGQRIPANTQSELWSMAPPSQPSNPAVQDFSRANDGYVTVPILVLTRELL